ncbi:amidase [Flavisphingomonas formosensis]|uniref:amidase n=1 Tax=Flavisphingomonas formosensis TaxID=861534 RepID=UPI0012FA81EC|nr:amidase [Sphingomonas formosensis]
MTESCDLTAREMIQAFAARTLSPVEVMQSVLDRMAMAEPVLAATWAAKPERALAEARRSERRWASGAPAGPLDGVPVTIKELIATEGDPKPVGSAAGDMTPQPQDAPPVQRLREAGAIPFAKTTNPDYGMLSSGLSSFHALSRNPWDTSRTPGGSSAGAGSAAAAGYGPLHLGTDIGGSIRLPAGWCGIFGLKPSFGRVPIDPPYIGRVAGPMTRTVADAALIMAATAQPDERDYMSLPPADIAWDDLAIDLQGLRIGLLLDAGCGMPAEPETREAVIAAARLIESAGAIVEPVRPFLTPEMLDGLDRFWRTRFHDETRSLPPERYATILPYIRAWVEPARGYDGLSVYTGFDQIIRMQEAGIAAFRGYDFMLSPTAPVPAFPADWASPVNDPARPFEHIGFTVAYNMTEQPAASINCGYTAAGLPIGLQIIGRRFDDLGVLRLAHAYEAMRPAQRPWPRPWTGGAA